MSWRCAPYSFSSAPSCWELSEFGNESNDNAKGRIIAAADGGAEHRGRSPRCLFFCLNSIELLTRHARESGHPVDTNVAVLSVRPVFTGLPAFAGNDDAEVHHSAAWRDAAGS